MPLAACKTTKPTLATAIRRDEKMSKEELIQFEGLVIEILPDARYRVQLDAGYEVVAYTAGKMKKSRIKTLVGWPAPGSEDTELGVLMELEVGHAETEVYPRVRA